ncbi:MAG: hypothetical protein IKW06_00840 [Clostridia bacterium]|nr:hypothetical protein [Clostridia bacterium]
MSLFYKLGGITLQTEDYFDEKAKHELSFYETEPTENPDMRITMHFNCEDIVLPPCTLVAEVNKRHWCTTPDGGYLFYDKIIEYSDKIFNLMVTDDGFRNVEIWLCPKELLKITQDRRPYYIIQEILRYAILLYDGLIIHSSSLAYQNQGLLFSAPSGTGKSTHTGLWKKYAPGTEIVNDDMPIICIEDGTPYLYGAPWSGKSVIHKNVRVPLKAIIFLERGETCSLTKMDSIEAVWRMLAAVRKPAIPLLGEKNLELLSILLETLPAYLLKCDISEEAVKTAMQALEL